MLVKMMVAMATDVAKAAQAVQEEGREEGAAKAAWATARVEA